MTVPPENGLTRFAMHRNDPQEGGVVAAIGEEVTGQGRARSADVDPSRLNPETAARRYLARMIDSRPCRSFPRPRRTRSVSSTAPSAPRPSR